MAYIYQIQNDINNKLYVGKTEFSIEERFKQHCKDAFRERNEKRPLYAAMRKYGCEHFHISLIEETDKPEEREIYWIETLGTFKYGYNATKGGDGRSYLDYDLIYNLYMAGLTIIEIHNQYHWACDSIRKVLNKYGVSIEERKKRGNQARQENRTIGMYDKETDQLLKTFINRKEAQNYLQVSASDHIREVCLGKRKTAYGYKWKYL